MSVFDRDDVRLFSGRSNPALAQSIADCLEIPMSQTHVSRFSNDNLFVQLGQSVRGRNVYIVQSLTPPVSDHLVELLMMLDIAKSAAAKEIHAIVPYFSYARSDKKDLPRISITARLMADLFKTSGATQFMTMTLHSPQVHGFFSIPADPLTARFKIAEYLLPRQFDPSKAIVVSPDLGNAKQAARFAAQLGLSVASGEKTRYTDAEVSIGGMLKRQIEGFEQALVYDDEIATGGTMAELCRLLVDSGIKEILLICTHGLFLGNALPRFQEISEIREIITTDTVMLPKEKILPNMTILSVGDVFCEAIKNNYLHRSIAEIFEG